MLKTDCPNQSVTVCFGHFGSQLVSHSPYLSISVQIGQSRSVMVQISQSRSVLIILGPNWSSRPVMALLSPNWSDTVRLGLFGSKLVLRVRLGPFGSKLVSRVPVDLFGSKNLKNTPFAKDFDMNRFFVGFLYLLQKYFSFFAMGDCLHLPLKSQKNPTKKFIHFEILGKRCSAESSEF